MEKTKTTNEVIETLQASLLTNSDRLKFIGAIVKGEASVGGLTFKLVENESAMTKYYRKLR